MSKIPTRLNKVLAAVGVRPDRGFLLFSPVL